MDMIFADRYTFDDPGIGAFGMLFVFVVFIIVHLGLLRPARKRMVKTVKQMAEKGRKEIQGHSVKHWLAILNREPRDPRYVVEKIRVRRSAVLNYGGHDYFFMEGDLSFILLGDLRYTAEHNSRDNVFFLVAVGEAAVRSLAEQEELFRHVIGSGELAMFSIFCHADFTDALKGEKQPKNRFLELLKKIIS